MPYTADRTRETTETTGTGSVSLAGTATGYQTFVTGVGGSAVVHYCISNRSASEWEVGIGTVTDSTPDTLSRTTVLASSDDGDPVDFSAGIKDVFLTQPAILAGPFPGGLEVNTAVAASPNAISALESGTIYTNEGATALNCHTLPTAAARLNYGFYVQDSDGIKVTAATGDTIRIAASVSGLAGYAQSTTVGDFLHIYAVNATEWVATMLVGAGWSVT